MIPNYPSHAEAVNSYLGEVIVQRPGNSGSSQLPEKFLCVQLPCMTYHMADTRCCISILGTMFWDFVVSRKYRIRPKYKTNTTPFCKSCQQLVYTHNLSTL